ncbi:helix-turn-helix transcriptional regulator [Devosia sp.]|uniref:helix-turn-helix domain-containing protein n=1 Tax=Devosia sp. TaxID=1871048 RepID=UPI0026392D36|nr:helix-turn-helix transcriptional regulator [Devosia sp.]
MDGRARIAWNLRKIRTDSGVTQEALAVDADVDRTYVSGIEQGTFNPSIDVLDRIAAALGVDVARLLQPLPEGAASLPALKAGRKGKGD